MTSAIDATTAQSTPATEVDSLIQQVGDEYSLEVGSMMNTTPVGQVQAAPAQAAPAKAEASSADGDLEARLAQLRGGV